MYIINYTHTVKDNPQGCIFHIIKYKIKKKKNIYLCPFNFLTLIGVRVMCLHIILMDIISIAMVWLRRYHTKQEEYNNAASLFHPFIRDKEQAEKKNLFYYFLIKQNKIKNILIYTQHVKFLLLLLFLQKFNIHYFTAIIIEYNFVIYCFR